MSITGSKGGQQSRSYHNDTSTMKLDPQLQQALYGNIGRAQQVAARPYQTLGPDMIARFENPYSQQVIDPTIGDWSRALQMTQNDNAARAIAAHAFGGSRQGVVDAMSQSEALRNLAGILGDLHSQGYAQALQVAQQQNSAANQYPLQQQQMLNQAVGLLPTYGTNASSGMSKARGTSYELSASGTIPGMPKS